MWLQIYTPQLSTAAAGNYHSPALLYLCFTLCVSSTSSLSDCPSWPLIHSDVQFAEMKKWHLCTDMQTMRHWNREQEVNSKAEF